MKNYQKIYFEMLINLINMCIGKLREMNAEIHDNNDFDWTLDGIRYCEAQDKIVFNVKPWEGEK